ncbi:hypothetical protein B5807_06913 [Epicoccum nigrum]|uniref:Uncharacterized protein n=1 Tax=Epicoccum nigrum TaxID=105696 RepID=A0A1Y2LYC1_EPING|nr:hypothetical protein B5807_06913 [Epicoccum nigrum]
MEPTDATGLVRQLRLLTFLTTAIAVPLNIAATVLSLKHPQGGWWREPRRTVTAYCFVFIPLALTCFAASTSLVYIKKHGKSPRSFHVRALDLGAICFYIAVMIPCWALEIRKFNSGGFGLLTGYLTAPMIINMFIHAYFLLKDLDWKTFRRSFAQKPRCQQCPNCQANFITGASQVTTSKGYSLLRGEDYLDVEADPIQYRDSEDFLGEGAERAERAEQTEQPEQARAAEDNSKGKEMIEV